MREKVFVAVEVVFDCDGNITPIKIVWQDGQIFWIDKILDIRRAASLKAGGQGIRYTCRIKNQETYLFYEEPKWFVEARKKNG